MSNKTKQIYTVAHEIGLSRSDEQMIRRTGGYGTGPFPPFFHTKEEAETYNLSLSEFERGEVVECELVNKRCCEGGPQWGHSIDCPTLP